MHSGTGYLLLFCKGTIATVQKNLFFGMYFSVSFVPRSLATASFSRKFYLLFLPLGNIVTEKVISKSISENLMFVLKKKVCWGNGRALTKTKDKSCKIRFSTLKFKDVATNWCKS